MATEDGTVEQNREGYAARLDHNVVSMVGNLVDDAQLEHITNKTTGEATAHCRFRIAVNNGALPSGEARNATFIDVDTWGAMAKNCSEYLGKGDKVAVSGRLGLDEWRTKEGEYRSRYIVQTARGGGVQFLTPRQEIEGPEMEPPSV